MNEINPEIIEVRSVESNESIKKTEENGIKPEIKNNQEDKKKSGIEEVPSTNEKKKGEKSCCQKCCCSHDSDVIKRNAYFIMMIFQAITVYVFCVEFDNKSKIEKYDKRYSLKSLSIYGIVISSIYSLLLFIINMNPCCDCWNDSECKIVFNGIWNLITNHFSMMIWYMLFAYLDLRYTKYVYAFAISLIISDFALMIRAQLSYCKIRCCCHCCDGERIGDFIFVLLFIPNHIIYFSLFGWKEIFILIINIIALAYYKFYANENSTSKSAFYEAMMLCPYHLIPAIIVCIIIAFCHEGCGSFCDCCSSSSSGTTTSNAGGGVQYVQKEEQVVEVVTIQKDLRYEPHWDGQMPGWRDGYGNPRYD